MKEEMLQSAINYLGRPWSIIPVGKNKKPLIDWKKYQSERATIAEVYSWAIKFGDDFNLAVVTGEISNITVVDVEAGGSTVGLPETLMAKSGGGGAHFFYKYKPGVQNKARIRELLDLRGDGGYIILAPSETEKGKYEWINDLQLVDFPDSILKLTERKSIFNSANAVVYADNVTNIPEYEGSAEGARNDSTTRYVGRILPLVHPSDWESIGWPAVKKANLKNTPPLSEFELRLIFESIRGREKVNPSPRRAHAIVEEGDEDDVRLMSEVAAFQSRRERKYFSTGMKFFDDSMRGGFKEGDLVAVTGISGHGKTSFAQTLTFHLAEQGIGTMFMSYEVLIEYIWQKFKDMGVEEKSVVYSPLKMTSGGLDWVEKKILEAIEKYGIKCVVLDHLGFLLPPKQKYDDRINSNYSAFLSGICRDLKLLALKNELIIILLAHVRKTDKPTMNDIKDTSGVAQESDYVFIIERVIDKSAGGAKLNMYTNQMEEKQNVFTDETIITLAKNRSTGQTFFRKFKMINELLIPV